MKIIIDGIPVPQLRPRATRMGKGIRMYDPKKVKDYKNYVGFEAKKQWGNAPVLDKALSMHLVIYRQIPKSTSKKKSTQMNDGKIRPIVKPDISNYIKLIEDALNGVVYKDDSQIVELEAKKFYSNNPRVEIQVKELKKEESTI